MGFLVESCQSPVSQMSLRKTNVKPKDVIYVIKCCKQTLNIEAALSFLRNGCRCVCCISAELVSLTVMMPGNSTCQVLQPRLPRKSGKEIDNVTICGL